MKNVALAFDKKNPKTTYVIKNAKTDTLAQSGMEWNMETGDLKIILISHSTQDPHIDEMLGCCKDWKNFIISDISRNLQGICAGDEVFISGIGWSWYTKSYDNQTPEQILYEYLDSIRKSKIHSKKECARAIIDLENSAVLVCGDMNVIICDSNAEFKREL